MSVEITDNQWEAIERLVSGCVVKTHYPNATSWELRCRYCEEVWRGSIDDHGGHNDDCRVLAVLQAFSKDPPSPASTPTSEGPPQ